MDNRTNRGQWRRAAGRAGLVAVAIALVLSVAMAGYVPGGPPVEPVAANHECDTTDYAFAGAFAGVSALAEASGGSAIGCDVFHDKTNAQQVLENESAQDKVDLYSAAAGDKATGETYQAVSSNYLADSESVAWMKAEAAIAAAYEDGDTKAEAKVDAREAISSYYAVKQINLIEHWNTTISSYGYLHNRSMQEGFSQPAMGDTSWEPHYQTDNFVDYRGGYESGYGNYCLPGGISTTSVTLVNSSTHTSQHLQVLEDENGDYALLLPAHESGTHTTNAYGYNETNGRMYCATSSGGTGTSYYMSELMVDAPNSNYDELTYLDIGTFIDPWRAIEQKNTHLQNEADTFVEATWSNYEDGTINSSDVLSRTTTMFEYGTASSSGNGSYYDVIGATAAMGLPAPDLNETGQMTVETNSGTYQGLVFANRSTAWETGTEYDPANMDGPVILATTDGAQRELTDPFTITGATDTTGESRSSVPVQDYNYQTSNTSELQEKYDELLNLTGELQDRSEEAAAGGGGSSGGGGSLPDWLTQKYFGLAAWIWAAAAVVLLAIFGGGN